jgi:NAD(P)-dependent dehydrogenase (short-subunit alcohol dehydrogenase family)
MAPLARHGKESDMLMKDRIALVTGAAGGIGRAVARAVVAEGGSVVLHDLDGSPVRAVAAALGPAATALTGDLADPMATDRLWGEALAVHSRVDVLVNNASQFRQARLDDPLEQWVDVWRDAFSINLLAPAVLCRSAVHAFAAQPGGGIIVNVASVTAFRGALPDYWHYGAAKGGIVAMTRTIARFYGRQGVTAFVVAPGFVDTPMARSLLDDEGLRATADANALGEVTQPQDVAEVVVFLASGRARHATGTVVDVNAANFTR